MDDKTELLKQLSRIYADNPDIIPMDRMSADTIYLLSKSPSMSCYEVAEVFNECPQASRRRLAKLERFGIVKSICRSIKRYRLAHQDGRVRARFIDSQDLSDEIMAFRQR